MRITYSELCACSHSYTACNTHSPHYHLWSVRLCNVFPHYLIQGAIYKKVFEHKIYVTNFFTSISETFLIPRRTERWSFFYIFCLPCISIYLFININQLDALNLISLFQASTCFEHMCSKHVEAWNKIIKFSASSWLILINKYMMKYLLMFM